MNCVGFKMSINVCLVRSSGQGPSCNNALGSRAALPGRREPKLRWLTCLEEGWQVGQAPRANFCFLWTVNSWLVNFDVTVPAVAEAELGIFMCSFLSPAVPALPRGKPLPPVLKLLRFTCLEQRGWRQNSSSYRWPSMHQTLALTCSW